CGGRGIGRPPLFFRPAGLSRDGFADGLAEWPAEVRLHRRPVGRPVVSLPVIRRGRGTFTSTRELDIINMAPGASQRVRDGGRGDYDGTNSTHVSAGCSAPGFFTRGRPERL